MSDPTDPHGVGRSGQRGREAPRIGDSGSPVGSPLTIALSVIAVVAGFLIFRSIGNGDAGAPDATATSVPTAPAESGGGGNAGGATSTTAATQTSAPTRTGATVVVINAGEVGGSAGAMSEELAGLGYTMEPGITDNDDEQQEATVVYFAGPGGPETVARSVAADLGGVAAEPAPNPLPILEGDSPGAATVYVVLGTDLANQELPLQSG